MNRTLALAGLVVAAGALSLLPLPAALRTAVLFPVLVLVAGSAATRLVLGRRDPGHGERDEDADVRFTLPALTALLVPLAVVLLLTVFEVPIGTPGIAIGTAVLALALVFAAHVVAGPPALPTRLRRAVGPVLAVVVLGGAVAGAAAMRPEQTEVYQQLQATGSLPVARAGAPVSVPWTLVGYGAALPDTAPTVAVTVAGTEVPSTSAGGARQPSTAPGGVDERSGTATFAAPSVTGLYDVRLTVDGQELVLRLQVTA
ncbi:hypothetical protein [Actinokineospora bangkokensis]|uniref:DUF1616 domain-containing protein n=1 Tax=Actinokineospora bangkokensis TaxID=1193682 RepID=A0A1Q9LK80_9PSEU|nr:hypothetical protein [Actinokineospora bangkokensis]OLR92442.1 hypothetical protein BJP25_20390 [Actinokineospora bangkokensis]